MSSENTESTEEAHGLIMKILTTYNRKNHKENTPWTHRYEFYTPIDCVGFCYFGETSSLRLLQRIGVNQLTSMCRNNTSSNGNTALFTNRGEARKRKRPEYGTVLLKDLFAGTYAKANKSTKTIKPADSFSDIITRQQIDKLAILNAESILPVDPECQLEILRKRFPRDTIKEDEFEARFADIDRCLYRVACQEDVGYFSASFWSAKKLRISHPIRKRYSFAVEINKPKIKEDYQVSVKRAFIDYILSDPNNRVVFAIKNRFLPFPIFVIRAPVSWHQSVLSGKNFMRHNLFLCHVVLRKLNELWFQRYEKIRVIAMDSLTETGLPMEFPRLNEIIDDTCDRSRDLLLSDWLTECVDILMYYKSRWDPLLLYDQPSLPAQARKFFNSIFSLMSLHLRRFITNSLNDLLRFILFYQNGNQLREYKDFQFLKRSFVTVNVEAVQQPPYLLFAPSFDQFNVQIQNLFRKVISVSENVPRIETRIFAEIDLPQPYLLPVRITESHIQLMLTKVLRCCEVNSFGPISYVEVYRPYFYYLSEQASADLQTLIHRQPQPALKVYVAKVKELISLQRLVTEFRPNVPLSMVNLNCDRVNRVIWTNIGNNREMITRHFLNVSKTHNERIMTKFEEISQRAGEIPESTKDLVDLNNYITESKTVVLYDLKKQLLRSAEYIDFLMDYAEIPEDIIAINTKVFRWPKHLEQILELATSRINHKLEVVENILKNKKSEFSITLSERSKQLDVIKKKDPPMLSVNEMKDIVTHIDKFTSMLEQDEVLARDINIEEELLNTGTTSYQNLYDIISELKPFSEMWHTVYNFHVCYDEWYNCPFTSLNAAQVKTTVEDMRDVLSRLLKVFYDVPGSKRVVEIVLAKVEKFYLNIPILETICNPGLQERHWKQIDGMVGEEVKRSEDTTISEILNYGLNKHVPFLQEINTAATEEYALEKSLLKMKDEWNNIFIQYETYRDSSVQILTGIDDIQVMLDDYLLRIQTMRGSPFVGAIESDIEVWEHKLILMQDILDQWLQVQNTWLYLEPLFCSEDIMRQMPDESESFNEVNKIWGDIMAYTTKNPNILVVIEYPNMMNTLKECNCILESIKKGLNNYLEKKRLVFPRFFFLSNRELLEILSESKDYSHIQSHLKCFEGIHSLDITENFDIIGIISDRGENVPLNSAISPAEAKGIVERWLDQLEDSMIQSLCDINSKAVRSYPSTPLLKWIFQWPAMVSCCALHINWTIEVENAFKTDALNDCYKKFQEVSSQLISLCNSKLTLRDRGTISSLILLTSYLLDITKTLFQQNITDVTSVHWIKQIRYYNEEQTTCIRILRTTLTYGYEYLGNVTRLIITPETERCYRIMSSAIEQSLFVCLMGPSGIGKTEICKDFSKAVAKPYCSFRCCENIGYKTISTFLKGCMQMGAWLCFDNIDRMSCEQLSIAAEEIRSIHLAIREKKTRFKFDGVEIPLNTTCNIAFTFVQPENFNKTIPDNLRKVLRPIIIPIENHTALIQRILVSFGFVESLRWSMKILEVHRLCNELLFLEYYYKSDLRTIKRVLRHVEYLKNDTDLREEIIILQSIKFVYSSKFQHEHRKLLNRILHKTFPNISIVEQDNTNLREDIIKLLDSNNLVVNDLYVEKLLELHETMKSHQGIILLGESFTGKTKAYQILMELMKNYNKDKVQHCIINHKSMTVEQLYGHLDVKTGEWSDGIFSKTYQEYAESTTSSPKWIIFDGPIDHNWIDRLTTVLDENKKLCLVSGEIIPMNKQMNVIFETDSLNFVPPAIIQNCAIVTFETKIIGWRSLFAKFSSVLTKKLIPDHVDTLRDIIEWIVPAVLEFITDHAEQVVIVSENYMFNNFSKMMIRMLESQNDSNPSILWVQSVLLFCIVWGFAGNISQKSKLLFDVFYRNLLTGQNEKYPIPAKFKLAKNQLFPEKGTVFDWACEKKSSGIWIPWINTVENSAIASTKIDDLFIYTADNALQLFFLKLWFQDQQPSLLIGPPGNGKSTTMLHYLSQLPADKFISNVINLSHYTSARNVQEMVMSKIDRRRKGVYGPSMGKKIILAFDDFETSVNSRSTEKVVELLRLLLERKFWYDLEDSCRIELIDFMFTGAMTLSLDHNTELSPRFIHHVNLIPSKSLNETAVSTIFSGVLEKHLSNNGFSLQICQLSQALTTATLDVYRKLKQLVSINDKNPSYFLDFQDIFRVFSGIGLMSAHKCQGVDELFRLWVHELMRVFGDKFEADIIKEELLQSIKLASCQYLRQRIEQYMSHLIASDQSSLRAQDLRNLFFCNFASHEHKYYDEVTNINTLIVHLKNLIKQNPIGDSISASWVLFKYIMECISSVVRAFQKDKGHVVMVGLNGSGRRTILKLAALVAQFTIFEINSNSSYDIEQWHKDLKHLLLTAGMENKSYLFVLSDDQIRDEKYFDDINIIMSTDDISYIYTAEEKSTILNKMMDLAHEEGSKIDTAPTTMYNFFLERLKRNLHIAIAMNPAHPDYYNRLHMVPCILKCSSFIWLSPWPEDALNEFADEMLKKTTLSTNSQLLKDSIKFCTTIHRSAIEHVNRYNKIHKTTYYVSSCSYIKFLSTFHTLYENKIEEISSKKNRYKQGLEKLNFTADQVVQMQNELQVLKPKLLITSDATEKLMIKIEQNTVNIETAKEIVAADEALANEAAAASQAIRDDCESDLSEAEPALISATNALNTLKSSDITVIKAMKNPPSVVKLVLEAVCVMKGMKPEYKTEVSGVTIEDYWPSSLKLLSDAKFLENLKYYDKENIDPDIMSTIRERYITHPDFDPDIVKKVSNACEGLCKWVRAMEIYDRVIKIVRPKKIKLAKAEEDYGLQMEKLNEKRAQLTEVLSKLQVLRDELAEKTKQKKELEDSIELCTLKLERAGKLIKSLSYEKLRWFELETELDKALARSVGDIFLSSAFITYLSVFSSDFRKEIIDEWCNLCKERKLPLSSDYSFSANFIDSDDIRFWNMARLSTDPASVDNYTIISKTIYFPVVIDPQGQGKNYIKHVENKNNLKIIKITDENYVDVLKKAITDGNPILLQDVPEKLNDIIVSMINFDTFEEDDIKYLKLDQENIVLNEHFKMYITSSISNPNFEPDISNKVTIINFEMTPQGLENCLLRVVISVDAPDLEEKNNSLLLQCAEDSRTLYQTEDKILNVLSSSVGNILEDETALQTLNDSKNLLEQIRDKQKHSLRAEQNLKQAYKSYKIVSKQATNMYFGIQKLPQLNALYCFSVEWFIALFQQAVKKSPKSQVMKERISSVNKCFTSDLYREIDMCLEKKDMLAAAFVLAVQMKPVDESLKMQTKSHLSIMLCESQLPIIGKFVNQKNTWKIPPTYSKTKQDVFILEEVQCNYDLARLEIEILLNFLIDSEVIEPTLLSSLGTDKFISDIQDFIENIFEHSEEPTNINLYEIYHNTDIKLPIICGLTDTDVDPLIDIQNLASEIGLPEDVVQCVPFIKTQIPFLIKSVMEALSKGIWIVIKNCHLLETATDRLEFLNDFVLQTKEIHPQFRLWIVTAPFDSFPSAVSSKGIKIMMKEPSDLGAHISHLYTYTSLVSPHLLEIKKSVKNWQFLLFFVYFSHSALKLIWNTGLFRGNKFCNLTKINLHIITSLVEILFSASQDEFINGFRYLIDECNYRAHLPDVRERLILSKVIESFEIENFSKPTAIKICDKTFNVPEDASFNGCLRYAQNLKKINPSEYFRLFHCMAEERCEKFITLWKLTRKLYFGLDSNSLVEENKALIVIHDILNALNPFYKILRKCKNCYLKNITNVFLKQEISLYVNLIDFIFKSLIDLQAVILGRYPKTEDHKKTLILLQNNEMPKSWNFLSYPTCLSLLQYITNLNQRLIFINKWIHYGTIDVVWLPGLMNIRAFFTNLSYNFSTYHNVGVSDVDIGCIVTEFHVTSLSSDEWENYKQEQLKRNRFCLFIQGLLLLGSSWNRAEKKLDLIAENNHFDVLPILCIEPKIKTNVNPANTYDCPLYYTNTVEKFLLENYIISLNLPCLENPINLTQRGVKLFIL